MEQLKDKDKQLAGLRERVQGLQTDSSNTDTALATLEEALSEKVCEENRVNGWGSTVLMHFSCITVKSHFGFIKFGIGWVC